MKNRRFFGLLAVVLAVLAGCAETTPPPATAPEDPAPPTVPDTAACADLPETLPNLEVSAGTQCFLTGTAIQGDVTVAAGGDLKGISVQIGGSVRGEGAALVSLETSNVTGGVLINGGASAEIVDSNVEGDVGLIGSSSSASVTGPPTERRSRRGSRPPPVGSRGCASRSSSRSTCRPSGVPKTAGATAGVRQSV